MLKLVEERLDGDFILPEVSPHKTRISSLGNHNLDYIILMAVAYASFSCVKQKLYYIFYFIRNKLLLIPCSSTSTNGSNYSSAK